LHVGLRRTGRQGRAGSPGRIQIPYARGYFGKHLIILAMSVPKVKMRKD